MIASGFGEMAANDTALADWKLAHLLGDESLDETSVRQATLSTSISTWSAISSFPPYIIFTQEYLFMF
jgi:hypothetical protein